MRRRQRSNVSAGLVLYRRTGGSLEVFIAHPGGPFWAHRDEGAWTIPKGVAHPHEELLSAACREFFEETGIVPVGPYMPLGEVRQRSGKTVHAWAWEGDADPANVSSNVMRAEHPRGSGRWLAYPEIDRCAWADPETARLKLNPAQAEFVDRLLEAVGITGRA